MPFADFCPAINAHCWALSSSVNAGQTSRGKTLNCHRADAQFIKRIPIADGGLRGHVPTRPGYVTPPIGFLFIAPRFCFGLPSDPASRQRPCPFANLRLGRPPACEYLVRGLPPLKLSAMPGTHASIRDAKNAAFDVPVGRRPTLA
jgi:hypothetical protein